jgi:hypothetical protein
VKPSIPIESQSSSTTAHPCGSPRADSCPCNDGNPFSAGCERTELYRSRSCPLLSSAVRRRTAAHDRKENLLFRGTGIRRRIRSGVTTPPARHLNEAGNEVNNQANVPDDWTQTFPDPTVNSQQGGCTDHQCQVNGNSASNGVPSGERRNLASGREAIQQRECSVGRFSGVCF